MSVPSCDSSKSRWSSKGAATGGVALVVGAQRALRSIRRPHGRLHVYRCGGHWHIGHRDRIDTDRTKRRAS